MYYPINFNTFFFLLCLGAHADPVKNVLQAKVHAAIKLVNLLQTLIK